MSLAGKVFCLTGTNSVPRKDFEAWIVANGGVVAGSLTGKVRA
jgi:NAD-dependent DNA ligase